MSAIASAWWAFWDEATAIWASGGWAMGAIALVAAVLFGIGTHVYLALRAKRFASVPEATWRLWIEDPAERRGTIGRLIGAAIDGQTHTDREISATFAHLRAAECAPFDRDLRVMKVCVGAAPLFGLLGTVMGMLTTFGALGSGSGGEQTMGMIAKGISEALITTETGLVIALPGLFLQYGLARKFEQYKAFLAHLETVCMQTTHHVQRRARQVAIQRRAVEAITVALRAHVRRGAAAATTARRAIPAKTMSMQHAVSARPRGDHGTIS